MAREKLDWFEVVPLERRVMLAFAEFTPQGTLLVNGTSGDNNIVVSFTTDQVNVAMDGASLQFAKSAVQRLYVDAGAGSDQVFNHTSLHSTMIGGDGADLLIGGRTIDSIDGGGGDDTINGEAGNDDMTGGDGTDWVEYGDRVQTVADRLEFEIGFPASTPTFHVTRTYGDGPPTFLETDTLTDAFEVYGGSEFDDMFIMGDIGGKAVRLLGRGGEDTFEDESDSAPILAEGGAGNDTFREYKHNNTSIPPTCTLLGGDGKDVFYYGDLPAEMDGGANADQLAPDTDGARGITIDLHKYPNFEFASAIGGALIGDDRANVLSYDGNSGGDGPITIYGGRGNDTITGSRGADRLYGDDGDDVISGFIGNDVIYGGNGNDILNGSSGNDRINGGAGNDTLIGGAGRDHLYGETGDDYLNTRDNKIDTLYGGGGDDSGKVDHSKVNDIYHDIEKLV